MLKVFRRARDAREAARGLYAAIVMQARDPAFFRQLDIPDTMDSRFDLMCLHAWLVLDRLDTNRAVAQAFVNEAFSGFDEALRETGTGDVGMNRRLKTLAGAFYGRLEAYRAATGTEELAQAILRNVFRDAEEKRAASGALATYALATRSGFTNEDLADGRLSFAPIPRI